MKGVLLCDEEKIRIRELRKSGVSHARIARILNQEFSLYNAGTRTRNTVKSFLRVDSGITIRQVKVPRPVLEMARNSGVDTSADALSSMLTAALVETIKEG